MGDTTLKQSAYSDLRVAIVHEWLEHYAGSERVVEQLLIMYPQAEMFAIVDFMPQAERVMLKGSRSDYIYSTASFRTAFFPLLSWPHANCC